MNATRTEHSRRRGLARVALVWLVGCLTAGGALLAAAGGRADTRAPRYRTKSIEDVKVGDWVLAKDPSEAGSPTPHRVIALPRNWTEHIVHVRVEGGGELQATRGHPFFVEGRGWMDAENLAAGDLLRDERGASVRIEDAWEEVRAADTFNLTVAGVHTYYVMAAGRAILVHNLDPWEFGNYGDLKGQSGGDALDIHHYPQAQPAGEVIPGYSRENGLAVAVPQDQHRGMNGANYGAGEFNGTPENLIDEAKDNMEKYTKIPPEQLDKLDAEARRRYLPCR